jgi:hypothetical protein
MVTVKYRQQTESASVAGKKVADVRVTYGTFNIPTSAKASVNGTPVGEDRVLADGEKLEFKD